MPNQHTSGWNHETIKRMFELCDEKYTFEEVAQILSKEYRTFFSEVAVKTKHYRELSNKDDYMTNTYEQPFKEDINHKENGEIVHDKMIKITEEEAKSPKRIMELYGYDPNEWEVINAKVNFWDYRDKESPDGKVSRACRLNVKPKPYELTFDEIKQDIRELMKDYKPPIFKPIRYSDNGQLLEVNVSDLHLNKLGYVDGEYDSEQAEKIFFYILNDILTRTEGRKFEKILFVWSHDFFNIDNLTKSTTSGTPQDTDKHFSRMYKQGKRMLVSGIDLLKQFAPVETIQIGANHDNLTSYTLSEVLETAYEHDENVIVDTDPLRRKYYKFGKSLIGFSHGEKEKKRLGKIMPIEARQAWGETLFCEIHAAHLHSEQAVREENGTIVRYLSSPSGSDLWHYESGYVGAIRKVQHFIWDRELGMTENLNTVITNQTI